MEKTLYFHNYSDYRSGMNIVLYDPEHEEDIPEEAFEINFSLPKQGFRLYIINEYPNYDTKPIWYIDLKSECEKIYKKMFSQIYGCMPFEMSESNSAYKEEGEYPEISEEIRLMTDIGKDITDKIKENMEEHVYFLCILNANGDEIITKILSPIC
jgi:hypothetical protein